MKPTRASILSLKDSGSLSCVVRENASRQTGTARTWEMFPATVNEFAGMACRAISRRAEHRDSVCFSMARAVLRRVQAVSEEKPMNRTITHILVPTDFSAVSDAALDYAIAIARRFGASLHLLHVLDDPFVGGDTWGSEVYIAGVPAMRETLIEEASAKLSRVLAHAQAKGIPARSEVRLGRPATMIRDTAEKEASDLIVMGTHGRTGVTHALLGSVAEKMVRVAPCPVLTVRAADPLGLDRALLERELVPTE